MDENREKLSPPEFNELFDSPESIAILRDSLRSFKQLPDIDSVEKLAESLTDWPPDNAPPPEGELSRLFSKTIPVLPTTESVSAPGLVVVSDDKLPHLRRLDDDLALGHLDALIRRAMSQKPDAAGHPSHTD